jgi:hypothetical protein
VGVVCKFTFKRNRTRILLLVSLVFLVLGVGLGLASIYPAATGQVQSKILIDDTFHMSPNEVRRQGIGAFEGGENLTLLIMTQDEGFVKNFSVVTYTGLNFNESTSRDIIYQYTAGADYYEAVFTTDASQSGDLAFKVSVNEPQVLYPLAWLGTPAKVTFILSLAAASFVLLKNALTNLSQKGTDGESTLPMLGKTNRRRLLALILVSLSIWMVLLAFNSNPLGTFENWYTDHARHPYTANLFLKDGFEVYSQPLDILASRDSSSYMYVTWPEMPHLYPIGSIALFLPFGALLEAGVNTILVLKLEIALFLVFAHLCLYLFLKLFLKKDMRLFWKLVGFYIFYVTLVIFAADGMFDSISLFFGILAVSAFFSEKYDKFLLLVVVAAVFKYQAAIFLFPFIAVGLIRLFERYKISAIARNWIAWVSVALVAIIGVTAWLSLPYLIKTRPELVLNGINSFSSHAQLPWALQSTAVAVTLTGTLVYALYMLKRNSLLSLSSIFLLLPSFTLPYFQNWYLPFYFLYILIPQQKRDSEVTIIWLSFIIFVLSFGGIAFNPIQIFGHLQSMFGR